MFGDGSDNQKPGIEEQYASAVGSSNLRVGNDSGIRTPGDMIAAAGMNKHRTGLALRRLMTEWDAAQHPEPMDPEAIEALATKQVIEGALLRVKVPMTADQIEAVIMEHGIERERMRPDSWSAAVYVPNPHAGLVRTDREGKVAYCVPLVAAKREAEAWHAHELGILFQSLKSLSAVRDALGFHAVASGLADSDGGVHLVSAVLQWWLNPTCPACAGRKLQVVTGTGRVGNKACKECRLHRGDAEGTGLRKLPHGWRGQKLVDHIEVCLKTSAADLREGARKDRRSEANQKSRDDEQKRLDAQGRV